MYFSRDLTDFSNNNGSVATIGNYDGIHLGHRNLLQRLLVRSKELGLPSIVVIFEPQPIEFFHKNEATPRLTTLRDKLEIFKALGIDRVVCLRFTNDLANLSAKSFIINVLIEKLKVKYLIVGEDFYCGNNKSGDIKVLQQYISYGLQTEVISNFCIDGIRVSSNKIRIALASGDFALAEKFLGRPYTMSGRVVHGNHLGRILGFPTANILLHHKNLPFTGVFIVGVKSLQTTTNSVVVCKDLTPPIHGVANVGKILEVHLLNFDADIYGKRIVLEFIKKLRDEIKFPDLEELQMQITQDVEKSIKYFRGV